MTEPDEDLITSFAYDVVGNQKVITDTLGRATMYDYDALNRVITITNPIDGETVYGYDAAGNRTSVTDAKDQTTTFAYDKLNRVVTTTNELEGKTIVSYDAVGNRTQMIDANTNAVDFEYDSLYRLTKTTDAELQETSTTYDALGNRLTMTDAELTVTKFEYDTLNRLITTTMNYVQAGPSDHDTNVTTVVAYDALSRRTSVVDGRDKPTSFGYDKLGRTIAITDALTHVTETEYDGRGNRRFVTNAESETTEFLYDEVDRLITTFDPLSNTTTFVYNKGGERTEMVDAETVKTTYTYDDLSRLITVIENYVDGTQGSSVDEDLTTRYGYDAVGNRTVITNAEGFTTTFAYDGLNRRTSTTDALGNLTQMGYDAVGNRTVITDAKSVPVVTSFGYDKVNRLKTIDYSDSTPDVTFTYDKVGNRKTMDDGTGTTTYSYDDLYRLSNVNDGAGDDVGYTYDEVGNRKTLTYPDSKSVTYTYDDANRLDTITTTWGTGQFEYTFDDANRLTDFSRPNGVSSLIDYDAAGRPITLTHETATETLASYSHVLDGVGNRLQITGIVLAPVPGPPLGTFLEADGQVVMEAEHFADGPASATHDWEIDTSLPGYTGTAYIRALPDIDLLVSTSTLTDPSATYPIQFTNPGTYTVWSRANAPNAAGDSLYVDLNGQLVTVTGSGPGEWDWANLKLDSTPATMTITATGLYTLTAFMREDGLRLDRMLLTTDTTFVPTGEGPVESARQTEVSTETTTITRTIVYTYDNLYRLTEADYDSESANLLVPAIDANFKYAYDAMGNQTAITETLDSTVVTTYTYNAANQLETARSDDDGINWYYTFDDKGNLLRQTPGGTTAAEGEMRYTYDAADRLIKVELYTGGGYTLLSEAEYNGDDARMELVTYALGVSQTVTYVVDQDGQLLVSDDGSLETLFVYGQSQIAEYTTDWNYPLRDSSNSVRQSVDEDGNIRSARAYKPFGGTLEEQGTYQSAFGFVGAQLDRVSGLLYANGRYYDPATGRYLTPDHSFDPLRPGTLNPYAPLQGPWWLLLPFVGVVFLWRRRKDGPWRMLVLVVVVGVILTSCDGVETPPTPGLLPTPPTSPVPQNTPETPAEQTPQLPIPPSVSTQTPLPLPCPETREDTAPTPTSTPIPTTQIFFPQERTVPTGFGTLVGKVWVTTPQPNDLVIHAVSSVRDIPDVLPEGLGVWKVTVSVHGWGIADSSYYDKILEEEGTKESLGSSVAVEVWNDAWSTIGVQHQFFYDPRDETKVIPIYTVIGGNDAEGCWRAGPPC